MTREEAIDKAVRKWMHIFDRKKGERDAPRIGATNAIGRQRLFVKCVRMTFAEIWLNEVLNG